MTTFAIFSNGVFWGNFDGADKNEAMQAAACEFGAESAEGLNAFPVTDAEASEVKNWWDAGADADEIPEAVAH